VIAPALDLIAGLKPEIVGEADNTRRWLAEVGARPGVQRGMAVPKV